MRIQLEVFLPFRSKSFWRGEEELADGTTLAQLMQALGFAGRPEIAPIVNGRFPDLEAPLQEGDLVTFVRRSEGG